MKVFTVKYEYLEKTANGCEWRQYDEDFTDFDKALDALREAKECIFRNVSLVEHAAEYGVD